MTSIFERISRLKVFKYQKIRFLFVGGVNTAFDFTLFNLFISLFHLHSIAANTVSVCICMVISYFLNHFFVFRSKRLVTLKAIMIFMLTTGVVLLVTQNTAIAVSLYVFGQYPELFSFNGWIGSDIIEANLAKLIAVSVSMVANFTLYKYVIFNNREG